MSRIKKEVFANKLRQIFVFVLVFGSLCLWAGSPEKKIANLAIIPPAPVANTNDFLADTIDVFSIAKDVSQLFSTAIHYSSLNDVYGDTAYLNALFNANYTSNDVAEAYKQDVEARIKSQKGDIGVDFRADYSENFKPGLANDEDIFFKRRFYFGVEWNVIKGGFLESRTKANQLEKEYFLKDIDAKKRADAENYRFIFNYINYIFNKQKIDVLKERYNLIAQQLQFTNELYHLRYVGWEKVLHIRAKLEDLNQQIAQLENFNQHIPNNIPDSLLNSKYSAENLPLVDVDLNKLMQIYHSNETTDTIASIKLAMFADGMKWWQDFSVRPYLRYNLYVDPLNQSRTFAAGGISVNVPLRFKNKESLVAAQEAVYLAEGQSVFQSGDNELVNHYAEFAFKLKQIKEFYYKKLFADELIRKEMVKKDFQDIGFNPIFTLGLIDDKKNIEAEIVDLKKRLYIQLVQMAFYLDKKSPMDFVEIVNPRDFTSRYSTAVQVFVDKLSFDEMNTSDLVNYLWKNEFRDVVIEIDSWNLGPKFNDLLEKATRDHIYFTLNMKIPKGQIYPNVNADLQEIVVINNKYVNGLHYSLVMNPDSTQDKEIQEVDFSDWLDGIDLSQKPKNIRLSISIADDLPINILNKVYSKFDLVFVPSDGTPNRQKLEEKLIQELALGKEKLTVILNGNDFADRLHLENYMTNLKQETGVSNFAFSNVKNMILADLRTYEISEKNAVTEEGILEAFRNQIFSDDAKNKAILQAKLDTIALTVKENMDNVNQANTQTIQININDNRTPITKKASNRSVQSTKINGNKVWQIQIAASKVSLSNQFLSEKFKVNEPIANYQVDGYIKYTIGNFKSLAAAKAALNTYKTNSGNSGAFLVSYE